MNESSKQLSAKEYSDTLALLFPLSCISATYQIGNILPPFCTTSFLPMQTAHGHRPKTKVITGSKLIVHAFDTTLHRVIPIVTAMQVTVDTRCSSGSSDQTSEFRGLTINERRKVNHHDERLTDG
jgi:hypothetical protein